MEVRAFGYSYESGSGNGLAPYEENLLIFNISLLVLSGSE